jgi:hypothetical protein
VQCFITDFYVQRAATLSKGSRVTVRGRVDGLMMNVLVKNRGLIDPWSAPLVQGQRRTANTGSSRHSRMAPGFEPGSVTWRPPGWPRTMHTGSLRPSGRSASV